MPLTQKTLFGSSIRSVNAQLGWNLGQQSSVTVSLVDDASNGDSFAPPSVGTAVYFDFYSFKFYGILQKYENKKGQDGYPVHEVVIVDPRELLENTQVILGGYAASITGIYNLVSPYGYYENTGFGNAGSNASGMLWSQVAAGLIAILNQPNYTAWGGPITFNATKYSIDLSDIPAMPANYRIGGSSSMGLLELIAQVCEDAACDFFIELVGYTITIRTVSRYDQPPLGTITTLTDADFGGTLIRSHNGVEVRNETTSSFLVGGKVSTIYQTSNLTSFWGFDVNGSPILGGITRLDFTDSKYTGTVAVADFPIASTVLNLLANQNWPNQLPAYIKIGNEIVRLDSVVSSGPGFNAQYNVTRAMFGSTEADHFISDAITYTWGSTNTDTMQLNASKVAEILGSTSYTCTAFEMRLALIDFNSWANYIVHHRSDIATAISLTSTFLNNIRANAMFLGPDLVNDGRANATALALAMVTGETFSRQQKFFEFVKGYAQNYMGKKYAATVPLVSYAQDPETLVISTSYEIADGGYLNEGATPLGLSTYNQDVFKNQDGTFRSFAMYSGVYTSPGANLSNLSPADTVIEASSILYAGCTIDPNFIYIPEPAVVVTSNEGLFDNAVDTVGSIEMIANVLMSTQAEAYRIASDRAAGANTVRIFPAPRSPDWVSIPLRSNVATYGPWYAQGAAGKVRFEQDPSLTPWEYGGYTTLNLVGTARVSQAVTNMQVSEAGAIELVGAPAYSLGDILETGGPNVTNIQISYSPQGVTTTYSFHTFSLKTGMFGVFGKHNTERLKNASKTATELRRANRLAIKEAEKISSAVGKAANTARARALLADAPPAMFPRTPHEGFIAKNVYDDSISAVRTNVSTLTFQEIVPAVRADDDDEFQATAAMSIAGVLRPFSTKANQSQLMPVFTSPTTAGDSLNQTILNPWKAPGDVEFFTYGSSYDGLHAQRRQPDIAETGMRGIGLRSPLVLVGWGYDWEGRAFPNWGEELGDGTGGTIAASSLPSVDGGFPSGYLVRTDWWAAGPLDTLYDKRRGVWTCHDAIKGVAQGVIPATTGVGIIRVMQGVGTGLTELYDLEINNFDEYSMVSGDRVTALYHVNDNKWFGFKNSDSSVLSSGSPYEVMYQSSSGTEWSGSPVIKNGVWVGGSGVGDANGKIGLGNPIDSSYLELESPSQSITTIFRFPNNTPTGTLRVKSYSSDIIETEWGVDNAVTVFDNSTPYTVLYGSPSGVEWSGSPTVKGGVWVGGSGIGATNGKIGLGSVSNSNYYELESPAQIETTVFQFPNNSPSGNLRVKSYNGNTIQTEWDVPATGLTTTINIVTSISSDGDYIVYNTRQATFSLGLLERLTPNVQNRFITPGSSGAFSYSSGDATLLYSGSSESSYSSGFMYYSGDSSGL